MPDGIVNIQQRLEEEFVLAQESVNKLRNRFALTVHKLATFPELCGEYDDWIQRRLAGWERNQFFDMDFDVDLVSESFEKVKADAAVLIEAFVENVEFEIQDPEDFEDVVYLPILIAQDDFKEDLVEVKELMGLPIEDIYVAACADMEAQRHRILEKMNALRSLEAITRRLEELKKILHQSKVTALLNSYEALVNSLFREDEVAEFQSLQARRMKFLSQYYRKRERENKKQQQPRKKI
ncbi:hypothetical protein HDU98_000601 [Podochytrium sp. JEL0797]|nr:hypothetical protein HDU98_000601 [Podochytrium sp. JEL0797]